MTCLQIGHPPLILRWQFLVWVANLFIRWHDGNRQFASRHWQACTKLCIHLWIADTWSGLPFVLLPPSLASPSKSDPILSISWGLPSPFPSFCFFLKWSFSVTSLAFILESFELSSFKSLMIWFNLWISSLWSSNLIFFGGCSKQNGFSKLGSSSFPASVYPYSQFFAS